MTPELKRALLRVVPGYFAWERARQERYRVDPPESDAFAIRRFLVRELFDINVSTQEELDTARQEMSLAQCNRLNATLLPIQGIGEDYFYLNEHFAEPKNLLSFETLYDYNLDDYAFQETAREKDIKNYRRKPYRGSFYYTWARLFLDGAFTYGMLCMVAGFLLSRLEDCGNDHIDTLIPHEFKHGKHHGKAEGDGYRYDVKVDANGLEPHLDELNHRFWQYTREVHERLMDTYDQKSEQRVYILDESTADERNHLFLFTDKAILKRIRVKSFARDCRAAEQTDHAALYQALEAEQRLLREHLDRQHADIRQNLDPNVVRFRKKMKVIFHKDSGLDELL